MVAVDVCICTFRRPGVVETLASVAAQAAVEGVRLRVVVADNDERPEAEARVREAADRLGLSLTYVHAPARNISVARNACLDAATGDFAIFLDDDETAAPGWLAALLKEAAKGWDAVLGPVRAVYADDAPAWVKAADLHSTAPVYAHGKIAKGYAGNALLRRATIEARALRFDLALGRQGGEDDDFFYRLTDGGGTIGYAAEALAYEPAPAGRTSLRWLVTRSFRTGQTHGGRLLGEARGMGRIGHVVLAGGKAAACVGIGLIQSPAEARRNAWLVRGALHLGVVARLAGVRTLQLY